MIATCELNRGAYRSSDPSQRVDDLASFKESGGIEYGLDVALVLRTVAGDADLVDVSMPKNRLGEKRAFRMRLDRFSATFREVCIPLEPSAEDAANAKQRGALEKAQERVLETVRKNPGLTSIRAVVANTEGREGITAKAVHTLMASRRLVCIDGVFRLPPSAAQDDEAAE